MPAPPKHYFSLGNVLYDRGKYEDAELNYRKAIQKDPKFGAAVYELGLTEIKEPRALGGYKTLSSSVALLANWQWKIQRSKDGSFYRRHTRGMMQAGQSPNNLL